MVPGTCTVYRGPDPRPSLGYESGQFKLAGNPLDLGTNSPDLLGMGLGASSVLPVRVNDPLLTFGRLWSGAQAAMQPTPGLSFEGRLLTGGASASFSEAAVARLIGTKTRCPAGFDQR